MKKSTFGITKKDCPSEEQMIRMKLDQFIEVEHLDFDIPNRKLDIYHSGKTEEIKNSIHQLKLGEILERT